MKNIIPFLFVILSCQKEPDILPVYQFADVTYSENRMTVIIHSDADYAILINEGRQTRVDHHYFGCISIPVGEWEIEIDGEVYELK